MSVKKDGSMAGTGASPTTFTGSGGAVQGTNGAK
jgi:hypothetical protein